MASEDKENGAPSSAEDCLTQQLTKKIEEIDPETQMMLNGGVLLGQGQPAAGPPGETLQERFARFRKERLRERKLAKFVAKQTSTAHNARDDAFRHALRLKFVETCKRYLGIPYHARYHGPDSEHFNAPLYLDCCGLVRRALQDLQAEFGFRIGRWNQNYQFDTLPEVLSFEELQPGDLIFVEGTYSNPNAKAQKYRLVHVEVFVGHRGEKDEAVGHRSGGGNTAERTIGARKQRGVIQVHESYKYTSANYEITNYHFRSLEPWLRGELKPQHPEHWQSRDKSVSGHADLFDAAGKRSVFNDQEEEESQEEEGGGGEEEGGGGDGDQHEESARESNTQGSRGVSEAAAAATAATTAAEMPLVFYVEKGNGWKLVAASLEALGWKRLPFEYGFRSDSFGLKWVQGRSSIDYVAHLQNHQKRQKQQLKQLKLKKKVNDDGTSGLLFSGGDDGDEGSGRQCQGVGVGGVQLVNHIPNNTVLTTKLGLLETLSEYFTHKKNSPPAPTTTTSSSSSLAGAGATALMPASTVTSMPAWFPESYRLHIPSDCVRMLARHNELTAGNARTQCSQAAAEAEVTAKEEPSSPCAGGPLSKKVIWILKPNSANCGKGIRLVEDYAELRRECFGDLVPRAEEGEGEEGEGEDITGVGEGGGRGEKTTAKKEEEEEEEGAGDSVPRTGNTSAGATAALATAAAAAADVLPPPAALLHTPRVSATNASLLDSLPTTPVRGSAVAAARKLVTASPAPPLDCAAGAEECRHASPVGTTDSSTAAAAAAAAAANSSAPTVTAAETKASTALGVAQLYLANPLLLEGRKFDLRVYGLVSRCSPGKLQFFHHAKGYARLSLVPYSTEDTSDRFCHLTNASVQKKHSDYGAKRAESLWSFERMEAHLVQEKRCSAGWATDPNHGPQGLQQQMKAILSTCALAAAPKLQRREGYFDLLGFDLLVGQDLRCSLLEVNTNPALHLDNGVLADLLPGVVDECLKKVLHAHGLLRNPAQDMHENGFELLVDEEVGFEWAPPN